MSLVNLQIAQNFGTINKKYKYWQEIYKQFLKVTLSKGEGKCIVASKLIGNGCILDWLFAERFLTLSVTARTPQAMDV